MAESDIEWTDATWNPVAGCTVLSPGCTNCYAMRMAARLQSMKMPKYANTTRKSGNRFVWTGTVNLDESSLDVPLKWKKPKRIFVNSMSDLFHDKVPFTFSRKVWRVMQKADWHQFQILTKRPDRMHAMLSARRLKAPTNVWVGTSVENDEFKSRIDMLRDTPAAVRFLSLEPLLGDLGVLDLTGIDWVIVGGESGPNARAMSEEWVDNIYAQCQEQEVPFFFKQWGGVNKKKAGRAYRGSTWDEFPQPIAERAA